MGAGLRQPDLNLQTARLSIAELKPPAHGGDGFFHDGKTQARALGRGSGRVAAKERTGELGEVIGRDARAVVAHSELHMVDARLQADVEIGVHFTRRQGVALGVFHQIDHNALQLQGVGAYRRNRRSLQMQHHGLVFLITIAHKVDQGIEIHRLDLRRGAARIFKKFADDAVGLLDVFDDVFARLLVGHAHLGFQP